DERHENKQQGHQNKRCEITCAHAINHAGNHTSKGKGNSKPYSYACECGFHPLDDYQAHDIAQCSAEGDAQTNFTHPSFHSICKHTINANRAEKKREQPEDGEQLHVETMLRQSFAYKVFERPHVVDWNVRIDLMNGVRYRNSRVLRGGAAY